jgi:hypothetical protein
MTTLSYVFQALVVSSLCFLAACLTFGALVAKRKNTQDGRERLRDTDQALRSVITG